MARWSGWGALPGVFDDGDPGWVAERRELTGLLDAGEWAAARRTTLNAHYTDAAVVHAMWAGVRGLGFRGGRVLEPGCGTGNFIGLAPPELALAWVGVEQDPITAGIARALYPHAEIRHEGFHDTRADLVGEFDAAVGNVPFGSFRVPDRVHNRGGHHIHNHFIIKSLDLVRPGGVVALITSRYALDAASAAARADMAARADLIGAIRLPENTFAASAGTRVITDILVLRRRDPDTAPAPAAGPWAQLTRVDTPTGEVAVNEWFARHPELVCGQLGVGRGQYRNEDLTVTATGPLATQLATAFGRLEDLAAATGLRLTPPARRPVLDPVAAPLVVRTDPVPAGWKEGSLHQVDGRFVRVVGGALVGYDPKPAHAREELAILVALRDTVTELLEVQACSGDDDAFARLQRQLHRTYDRYVERYGPINRFTRARTGWVDPDTGVERTRRLRPSLGGMRTDPDFPALMALEHFRDDDQTATKAAVFDRRVVAPRPRVDRAETAADALAVSLDELGRPELTRIAELLGVTERAARTQLGTLVWDDPATGMLLSAQQYLSGDVRARLDAARGAAAADRRWEPNVVALAAVLPPDLEPGQIDARPGASWIPAADVEAFVAEVLDATSTVEYSPVTSEWTVQVPSWARTSVAMTSAWGTGRVDAAKLLTASANQRLVTVYDPGPDDRRVVNPAETLTAREKQEALSDRFATWIWEDPARAARLAVRYNRLFNSTVGGAYDGSHLTLPGMTVAFTPHPHQRDATWRMVSEPTCLLAHAVGAGKTATMVMGAMELRRLGLASKPAIVVPNHMLEQFAREAKQLYPQANLLVATKDDVTPQAREAFVARCAMGDWDAVIMTHSSFERIPLSAARRAAFVEADIEEYRAARQASAADKGLSVKKLEAEIERLRTRHTELLNAAGKDAGVTFEDCGVDYLCLDEAHLFKNLGFPTRISGVGAGGSQRAADLAIKLAWLRDRNGARVATLATATPIANGIAEMFVMQRYLQPGQLAAAGVGRFDAWAASFATTVTAVELAPDGGSYRMATRFAKFRNVPELLTMFGAVADVRTVEDLRLPVPALAGGRPETVVVPASPRLEEYVAELVGRAERVRSRLVAPDEDNMLAVTGDGRRAALDLRLIGDPDAPAGTKIEVAADHVAALYRQHQSDVFRDPATDQAAARPGGLQLVFCDLGTPKPAGEWSVYAELRQQLVARGVPDGEVRFVHEAANDRAKADLFQAARDGRIAVLVGSTEKMGVGTNVQDRAVALHHLDCPWRPADLEQRDGRILRQGNQNPDVRILRYVTSPSFDTYSWQTVERKAAFIAQVTRGHTGRQIDDVGDAALSYAEVKALASGDPLILEKAGVDAEAAQLRRLDDAHRADQARLARTHRHATDRAATLQDRIDRADTAIDRRLDTRGDAFVMTVDGDRFADRAAAGAALQDRLARLLEAGAAAHQTGARDPIDAVVGHLAGFDLTGHVTPALPGAWVEIAGADIRVEYSPADIRVGDHVAAVTRLERKLRGLEDTRGHAVSERDHARTQAHQAAGRLGAPFPDAARLHTVLARQREITELLTPAAPDPDPVAPPLPPLDSTISPAPASRPRL